MKIGRYVFSPRPWITILTIIVFFILARLGLWQLHRADEKRDIITRQSEQIKKGPLVINRLFKVNEIIPYQPVKVTGHYIADKLIFLDNKPYNGVHGYQVITPFKIAGVEEPVLINRGWVAMPIKRENLPEIETSPDDITISGLAKIPKAFFTLGDHVNENNNWPWRIQWLDILAVEKQLKMKLQPFVVLQDNMPGDLIQDWKIIVSPPEKNISYAVQWFTMAAVLLVIFIVVNTKKEAKEHE